MIVYIETTGIARAREQLARLPAARRAVGEVYMEGGRNEALAVYHALGTSRGLPSRNVFWLPAEAARRVAEVIRQGAEQVLRGHATTTALFMRQAAEIAAAAFRANIDRGVVRHGRMAPLNTDYAKRKRAEVDQRPILVRSGEFREAIRARVVDESGGAAAVGRF